MRTVLKKSDQIKSKLSWKVIFIGKVNIGMDTKTVITTLWKLSYRKDIKKVNTSPQVIIHQRSNKISKAPKISHCIS